MFAFTPPVGRWFACLMVALSLMSWAAPARAVDYFWNEPGGGNFLTTSNWQPFSLSAPVGADDTANFNLGVTDVGARYTVTFVHGQNDRLLVHNDTLTLHVSGTFPYTLLNTDAPAFGGDPSLIVGNADGDVADVILTGDGLLQTRHASIGHALGSTGIVTVDGLEWVANGNVRVGNGGPGTLTIENGGSVSSTVGNVGLTRPSATTVTGAGSTWTTNGLNVFEGSLTIEEGGTVDVAGNAQIWSGHALDPNWIPGTITVRGAGSSLTIGGFAFTISDVQNPGGLARLIIEDGGTVSSNNAGIGNRIEGGGAVTVRGAGSTWTTADLEFGNFRSTGTLTISNGGEVIVGGTLSDNSSSRIRLDGGKLTVNQFGTGAVNALDWRRGTLRLTGSGGLTVGPGGLFGATLALNQNQSLEIDHTLAIDSGATLFAGGGLEAGSASVEAGALLFVGGPEQDFGSGLTNHGDLVFNASTTASGPVTNAAGAAITALDDVTFNDLVDGPGSFFGRGTVTFAGGFSPGASPAEVSFEGSVVMESSNTLFIELGGTERGAEYDSLQIDGTATLDGALDVSLINGFNPTAGDAFEILTAATGITGTFATEHLPALAGDLFWNVNFGPNTVTLAVAAPGLPGDFNGNGVVDAADYTVWRDGLGDAFDAGDYDVWKNNFGATAGATGPDMASAVPEPASLWLVLLGYLGCMFTRAGGFGGNRRRRLDKTA